MFDWGLLVCAEEAHFGLNEESTRFNTNGNQPACYPHLTTVGAKFMPGQAHSNRSTGAPITEHMRHGRCQYGMYRAVEGRIRSMPVTTRNLKTLRVRCIRFPPT